MRYLYCRGIKHVTVILRDEVVVLSISLCNLFRPELPFAWFLRVFMEDDVEEGDEALPL